MMFAKSFKTLPLFAFVLSMSFNVHGHAIVTPALGVSGTPVRSDVTRPSSNAPCGQGVNVANAIAGSTAVKANGNAFTVTVTNFNGGKDGSTQITDTSIDPSGTGDSFTGGSVTITKNGVAAPASTGSVQVSGTLPSGTKCTGGTDGASCLVSFTTAGKFGNCVLVSQGGGAKANNAAGNVAGPSTKGNDGNANNNAKGNRLVKARKLGDAFSQSIENALGQAGSAGTVPGVSRSFTERELGDALEKSIDNSLEQKGAAGTRLARSLDNRELGDALEQSIDEALGQSRSLKERELGDALEQSIGAALEQKGVAGTRLARSLKLRKALGDAHEQKRSWIWAA
ncbi:uncharacterized protein FOMMEDRAFT_127988 [Fomitiporia mediterranea MF3/22]|uniref:uncharacterized protein n=1 Tax=Fomitiporia mediterranea (strain MF3/22) TaxID=694068 RepID=UPI0004407F85|nr:uncharacterized protein FOMMEDRAFT_127988 [Fomitiporia mediterranea MF3/22]EJC99808.1 hypothetical protein FOMMEDRAFT_127988 [Fomitiporia mediterranea MF3/22]